MYQFILFFVASFIFVSPFAKAREQAEDLTNFDFDKNAIVAIKVVGKPGFCSGVAIGEKEVLTATHCIYDLSVRQYFHPDQIKIGIGENVFDEGFKWLNIKKIEKLHSALIETVEDFIGNDVVKLKTKKPLPVKPLKVAETSAAKSQLFAWGFGEDEWGYYGIKKSRKLEDKTLEKTLIHFSSGACRGDSGGPILDKNFQVVGIVSMSETRHCVSKGKRMAQRVGS